MEIIGVGRRNLRSNRRLFLKAENFTNKVGADFSKSEVLPRPEFFDATFSE